MRKGRGELSRSMNYPPPPPPPSISAPPLPLMVFSGVLFFFLLLENDEAYTNTGSNSNNAHHGFLQIYFIIVFVLLYVHVVTVNVRWLSRRPLPQPTMRSGTVNNGRLSPLWGLGLLLAMLPVILRYRASFIFLFAFLFLVWSYTG